MKKVLFSVVALVAFSFAGMANNEVKEEKVDDDMKVVSKEVLENRDLVKLDPCMDVAFALLEIVQAYSGEEFTQIGQQNFINNAYAECLGYQV